MMQFADRIKKVKPSPTLALNARAKRMQADGMSVINFTCGEPDFDTPEHIKRAAAKALEEGFTKYTAVGGINELKDAVGRSLKRELNLDYTRDEIIITPGAKYAIFSAMQAILNPDDEVIIPAPYWVSYPDQVLLSEGRPVIITATDKNDFRITPQQLEGAVTSRSRMLVINSPSNPTGMIYSEGELAEIAKICVRHNLWVISDEIYNKIVFDGLPCPSIASMEGMRDGTVVINGASKAYAMTGWRMGFAAGPKELISEMATIQGQAITNVTSFVQKAAVSAYDGPQDEVAERVAVFKERRDYMVKRLNGLNGLNCLNPQGTFYAFPNVSALFGKKFGGRQINTSSELSEYWLETAHVATVPGDAFGLDGFIRLSYATSMEDIKEGMDRIEKCLSV